MSKKSKTKKNDRLMKRKAGKEKLKKSESTASLEIESENDIENGKFLQTYLKNFIIS